MDGANSADAALRRRARQVIPNGLWGHQRAEQLGEGFPQFFSRADGCRLWDVDGREYLDFMCSWGPIVLGHHHPEVDEAARRQDTLGACMNGPGEVLVDLAEKLVDTVAHADWAQFQKNGSDATTLCVTIARAGTGKRKILVARDAYHGAVPWCSPSVAGVTAEDRAHLVHYVYNDVDSLLAAAAAAEGDLAGVLVSAFKHDVRQAQELPTPDFASAARRLCDDTGAALILDDVRAGFRIDMAGSWEPVGVRPDLSAFSKSIANGYPLAAVTGGDAFRDAAGRVFSTGSFWCEAVPMAAALTTLAVMQRDGVIAHLERMGTLFRDGLDQLAERHGLPLLQSGPVQMPMLSFRDDEGQHLATAFCDAAVRRGLYMHPWHNLFLSAAHRESDIAQALAIADAAMGVVAREHAAA